MSNNSSADNLTLGDELLSDSIRNILESHHWGFLEKSAPISTVAGTQFYDLPPDHKSTIGVSMVNGTTQTVLRECPSRAHWDYLNSNIDTRSDTPEWFFVFDGQVGTYPIPSSASKLAYDAQTGNFTAALVLTGGTSAARATITSDSDSGATGTLTLDMLSGTFQDNETITDSGSGSATANGTLSPYLVLKYVKGVKNLSVADYTAGTVVSITKGLRTLTGTGTTWTAKMEGRYVRITDSNVANAGDGEWYKIETRTSDTVLELERPYGGPSIASATVAYTIGQMPPLPEAYHTLPVYRALEIYFSTRADDLPKAEKFRRMYEDGLLAMRRTYGRKTVGVGVEDAESAAINPNLVVKI